MTGFLFEDVEVGRTERFGDTLVEREAVIDFASKFDPQPFHLSDEAAARTHFGRLAASGWHSVSMVMAMIVRHVQAQPGRQDASGGAAGVEDLRWFKPVYPGDRLSCESEVLEKIALRSRDDMGIVKVRTSAFNQQGEIVLQMVANTLVLTREGARKAGAAAS